MCNLHETQPSFGQDSNWKSFKRPKTKPKHELWKTSVEQRFFITFENKNWTTLVMIMYYGMGLIGLVPPRNVTSNQTSFCRTYSKHNWFSTTNSHLNHVLN